MSLPDHYASPLHLPFNSTCLEQQLLLEAPDQDPGGDGWWLLLRGNALLVTEGKHGFSLPRQTSPPISVVGQPLYIGRWQGRPCRLAQVEQETALADGLTAHDLLVADPELSIDLFSLGGLGRNLLHWEGNSRYCSKCGAAMQRLAGEWGKLCSACGSHHFPHIHPCVIVIVRRPGEILMTRKTEWPQGRYSLVAGFLEFGECLEEAVAREVKEETGIEVCNIRYIGSQGWPFPSQMMAGFVADYAGGELQVEEKELEDAGWFCVDDLPLLPPKRSIARYLIDTYARI
ncbi:MAG: NAD(+) diphosphatase [Desulfuromonadales bacterium]|nr:NAD(+) diphosphatase [Desulfuromonadales bacterium]